MNQNNFISSGIPNYGNTCFITSALQMLISIDEYRNHILNFNTNSVNSVNSVNSKNIINMNINIIKNLRRIFNLIIKKANLGNIIIINIKKEKKNTKNYKIYMFLNLITNFLSKCIYNLYTKFIKYMNQDLKNNINKNNININNTNINNIPYIKNIEEFKFNNKKENNEKNIKSEQFDSQEFLFFLLDKSWNEKIRNLFILKFTKNIYCLNNNGKKHEINNVITFAPLFQINIEGYINTIDNNNLITFIEKKYKNNIFCKNKQKINCNNIIEYIRDNIKENLFNNKYNNDINIDLLISLNLYNNFLCHNILFNTIIPEFKKEEKNFSQIFLMNLIDYLLEDEKISKDEEHNDCKTRNSSTYSKLSIDIGNNNKYLFIQLIRFGQNKRINIKILNNRVKYNIKTNNYYLTDDIIINNEIYINKIKYILLGIILNLGNISIRSGHYIYISYKNGIIDR